MGVEKSSAVRVEGCPAVWMDDSSAVRAKGCPAVRLDDSLAVRAEGCPGSDPVPGDGADEAGGDSVAGCCLQASNNDGTTSSACSERPENRICSSVAWDMRFPARPSLPANRSATCTWPWRVRRLCGVRSLPMIGEKPSSGAAALVSQ